MYAGKYLFDYKHLKNRLDRTIGTEAKTNFELAGGKVNMLTIREADYFFNNAILNIPEFPNNIFLFLSKFNFWRILLRIKRKFNF